MRHLHLLLSDSIWPQQTHHGKNTGLPNTLPEAAVALVLADHGLGGDKVAPVLRRQAAAAYGSYNPSS